MHTVAMATASVEQQQVVVDTSVLRNSVWNNSSSKKNTFFIKRHLLAYNHQSVQVASFILLCSQKYKLNSSTAPAHILSNAVRADKGGHIQYDHLCRLQTDVTDTWVKFEGRRKCTFVPCCTVRQLFEFTCMFIAVLKITKMNNERNVRSAALSVERKRIKRCTNRKLIDHFGHFHGRVEGWVDLGTAVNVQSCVSQ